MTEHAPGGRAAPARRLPTFLLMIVVLLGGFGLLANRFSNAIVVQTEPADSPGAQPGFIPTAGSDAVPQRPVHMVGQVVTGDSVGLYGGTTTSGCDAPKIRDFLAANPQPAQAWAGALRIAPADIDSFLGTLTALTLRTDTAVTNHGFRNGVANPFPSVLQAGTAVLVDAEGLPRVRCYCGNPLQTPVPLENVRYAGRSWSGFEPESVTVIGRAPREVMEFVVLDRDSDQVVTRPRATTGDADEPVSPAVQQAALSLYAENGTDGAGEGDPSTPASETAPPPSGDGASFFNFDFTFGLLGGGSSGSVVPPSSSTSSPPPPTPTEISGLTETPTSAETPSPTATSSVTATPSITATPSPTATPSVTASTGLIETAPSPGTASEPVTASATAPAGSPSAPSRPTSRSSPPRVPPTSAPQRERTAPRTTDPERDEVDSTGSDDDPPEDDEDTDTNRDSGGDDNTGGDEG